MKRPIVISSAAALVLLTAGYYTFFRTGGPKYDFRFDKVTKGDLNVYVTATGTVNPVTSVDVGTQVSGIVSKLYADFNSEVKAGQLIAQIDSTFLVQSVKDAAASLDKAQAQNDDSKRNLDREKALFERGLESQLNYDAARTTYESNAAALKSAQASLDRAKINLSYATIYAPINGVVINRAVNVGQTVAASFSSPTLFTIANDLRKMQVETVVDESDIGNISIGQEATFTVDAYPDEKFTGTVSQIRLAPQTVQNVVNYTVIIDVNNDRLKLMPGMTANVKVFVASAHDALRVSNMALRFQPPADLVDSSKMQARRDGMAAGSDPPSDSSHADPGVAGAGGDGRGRFRALRDSIVAAHGGTISQEDLKAEMTAAANRMQEAEARTAASAMAARVPKRAQFGITLRYPEFEKSPYIPQHHSGRARLWILNAAGKLEPVFVSTGVSDGRFTEITSRVLKDGDQIVMGATTNGSTDASQAKNPFAGQPQGGGRGGPR